MNKNNFIISGFILLFSWGCVSYEPHVFASSYDPVPEEYFAQYEDGNSSYSVIGSGFLRQVDGGTVDCGGNTVTARPVMPTSQYTSEYNNLSYGVQNLTLLDPQFEADRSRLNAISKGSFCDVDGKFEINGLTPGVWNVETTITWTVQQVCKLGDVSYSCPSQQGGVRSSQVTISDDLDKKEYKIMISS